MASLGRQNILKIVREAPPGLYLDGGELGEILLPRKYIPRDLKPKDLLNVFVYLDSEDRLVATTETPLAQVGEFAALKVVSVNRNVGAFLDWGLVKDLLLPFREHDKPVRVGDTVLVFVLLDPASGRIVASARLSRHLGSRPPLYAPGDAVNLLIGSETPLGYNAIVENAHRGLLYKDRIAQPLKLGQKIKGYIRAITPGGKIDLTLDPSGAYKQLPSLTQQILDTLEKNGGRLDFDDATPPERIRETFNVSKNTFKRALSSLYKKRRIRFTNPGIELLEPGDFTPGSHAANQHDQPARTGKRSNH
jgi:predicted RNA-binding protein (virulence factor B family)